jgi:hypothetical protein
MKVKLLNMTNTANIYGVIDEAGKTIGTVEIKLVGPDCGTYAHSWSGKYNKRDIRKIFFAARKNATTVY